MLNDLLKEYKCIGIPTGSTGAQMGGWFRKEIKSMEDFKGLKFRVGGFAGTIIAKVGGVPQQIAGGDIYPALEKGTIDAAEWVGPYDDEKLGFVKVAKYYYYPGWWEGTGQGHNIMNLEKWNALPKHYQAAIETASYDTFTWVTGKYDYVNPPALKRLLVAGAILKPFPQEVLEACYSAANEIYADLSKTNPHFNKMYASLSAFRNESLAWNAGRGTELRQLHDADAHPHLIRRSHEQKKPRRFLRGFSLICRSALIYFWSVAEHFGELVVIFADEIDIALVLDRRRGRFQRVVEIGERFLLVLGRTFSCRPAPGRSAP